jgi:hypothetical protein
MTPSPTILAPDFRDGTVDSIPVEFRAYLDENQVAKLIWSVGTAKGNDAVLDVQQSVVVLPQGRTVSHEQFDGRYVSIPRYLSTALHNDIQSLNAGAGVQSADRAGDESVTSMFD